MSAVQDMIANGEEPDESNDAMDCLVGGYDRALNESACPCGSGTKYADCCKREYQAAVRGVKGLKREQDAEPEEEVLLKTGEKPKRDVRWCCRVGLDRKTGEPVTDTTGMDMDDSDTSPQQIAGILLVAYHDLMVHGAYGLANGVYNKVMSDVGAVRAAARRRPPGRPAKR